MQGWTGIAGDENKAVSCLHDLCLYSFCLYSFCRKGLPVTARLTLLDTRFKEYQDAVIGTVLTTLHAGSVLLTFYLNFNLSLDDPNLPTTLKVQIQIQGAEQTVSSKMATLHHNWCIGYKTMPLTYQHLKPHQIH